MTMAHLGVPPSQTSTLRLDQKKWRRKGDYASIHLIGSRGKTDSVSEEGSLLIEVFQWGTG